MLVSKTTSWTVKFILVCSMMPCEPLPQSALGVRTHELILQTLSIYQKKAETWRLCSWGEGAGGFDVMMQLQREDGAHSSLILLSRFMLWLGFLFWDNCDRSLVGRDGSTRILLISLLDEASNYSLVNVSLLQFLRIYEFVWSCTFMSFLCTC